MPEKILKTKLKISGHLLFWAGSIVLWLIVFFYYENRVHFDFEILFKAAITNLGFAISVYGNILILIPKFLKPKNYLFYIFWLIILLSFSSVFIQFLIIYPLRNVLSIGERLSAFNTNLHSAYFSVALIYVAFTSFVKFLKDWFTLQDINYKLAKIEKQKLEAELKTLKGQLNPHFLFNSLNNIYSLSLSQSAKVPDLILKLSDLMRHIIYESRENYIPLHKEIEFVNNFIELQKIRTSADVDIQYEIKGNPPDAKIAPLLFEPFIDNAFKHGLPGTLNDFIHIRFEFLKADELKFTMSNNYEQNKDWQKSKTGIGLENVKQRLNHLYNKQDYHLSTQKENGIFTIALKLKLIHDGN